MLRRAEVPCLVFSFLFFGPFYNELIDCAKEVFC